MYICLWLLILLHKKQSGANGLSLACIGVGTVVELSVYTLTLLVVGFCGFTLNSALEKKCTFVLDAYHLSTDPLAWL